MATKQVYFLRLTNSKKIVILDRFGYEKCKGYEWRLNYKGYAKSGNGVGLMHRFILGLKKNDGKTVHHKDKHKLNNRRDNLQVLTEHEHKEIHKKRS